MTMITGFESASVVFYFDSIVRYTYDIKNNLQKVSGKKG